MSTAPNEEKQAYWFEKIADWMQSDKTQVGFCKEHGLSWIQFGYWRKKYLRHHGRGKPVEDKFLDVTAVKNATSSNVSQGIIIKCRTGVDIILPINLSLNQLLPLLEFLGLRHV